MERGLLQGLVPQRSLPAFMGTGDPANDTKVPVHDQTQPGSAKYLAVPKSIPWVERVFVAIYGNSYSASWGFGQSAQGDNYLMRLARRHEWLNPNSALSFTSYTTGQPLYVAATSAGSPTTQILYDNPAEGPAYRSVSGSLSTDIELSACGGGATSPSGVATGIATSWVPNFSPGIVFSDGPLNDMLMNVSGGLMTTKGIQALWNALTALYSVVSADAIIQENDASLAYTGTWTNHTASAIMHGGFWSFSNTINSKVSIKVPGNGAITVMLAIFPPESGFNPSTSVSITQNGVGVPVTIGGVAYTAAQALAGISMANQTVQGSMGAATAGVRADPVTFASGVSTITDTFIRASDRGSPVAGTGIPASSFVGTVTPGTSFVLSSSATSTVAVNTTAASSTGSGFVNLGGTPSNIVGHVPLVLTGLNPAFTLDVTKLDATGTYVGLDCYIQPAGLNASPGAAQTITALTNTTTTYTATVASTAGMYVGQRFTIANAYGITGGTSVNGSFVVATVPSSTTFTFVVGVAPTTNAYTASSATVTTTSVGAPTIVQLLGPYILPIGFTKYYCPTASNATIDQINDQVFRAVVAQFPNAIVVDPNAYTPGIGRWDRFSMLGSDGIHPNQRGYAFLADLIDNALLSQLTWRQGQNNLTV